MASYVVTGASRGIGFEFVRQLSNVSGNTVFAIVRNRATSGKLIELAKTKTNIHVLQADIVDAKALKAAAADVAKVTGGKLDYLINNAALVDNTYFALTLDGFPSEEVLEKDLTDNFHVNVVGVIHTINAFLPLLKKGTVKKVITITSGLGDWEYTLLTGNALAGAYSISKAAVNFAMLKYATEYKEAGFVFLSLSPGLVDTATAPPTEEQLAQFAKMLVTFRKVKPDFTGPITPEESVKLQLQVIYKWKVEDTGAFVSQHGNRTEWL